MRVIGVIAFVASVPITILYETVLRRRCPHCHRRGLRGGRIAGDPSVHDGDDRDFNWAECDYCHHQFHTFDDRSSIHIPPTDSRYIGVK